MHTSSNCGSVATQASPEVKRNILRTPLSNFPNFVGETSEKNVTPIMAYMHATTSKIRKELSTGTTDADRALTIFLRDLIRPKSRTTLNALIRRRMLIGMLIGPRATRDIKTTKKSNKDLDMEAVNMCRICVKRAFDFQHVFWPFSNHGM